MAGRVAPTASDVSRNERAAEACRRIYAGRGEPEDLDALRAVGFVVAVFAPLAGGLLHVETGDALRDCLPEQLDLFRVAPSERRSSPSWAPSETLARLQARDPFAPLWRLQLDRDDARLLAAFVGLLGQPFEVLATSGAVMSGEADST